MGIFKRFISRKKGDFNGDAKRQELFLKVREILAKELEIADPNKIQLTTNLQDDLGVESLNTIGLVMAFEEAFGIDIPDEDAEKVLTVEDIINYLTKKIRSDGDEKHG
jgi:acyl carrier protein